MRSICRCAALRSSSSKVHLQQALKDESDRVMRELVPLLHMLTADLADLC
jgi:hypothetical protein